MDTYILDWLSLLVRWLHLVTAIAWIGASFYFVWLDNHLEPADPPKEGVSGELWSVHGGGFYNKQKYLVAPARLPPKLHWFKWEAYWTWISGFTLLVIVYYANAGIYLVDRAVADITPASAIGISLASIVAGWVVYDLLCRSPLARHGVALGVAGFAFIVALAWALSLVFSGRGAFIQVGAVLGTIMAANVLMVIIPGQRRMVAAMAEGREPDPVYGLRGKQRSMHNNYLTLPVVFIMISNHYPVTYATRHNWAVLAVIFVAGALIRHFFNLRHRGRTVIALPLAGVALLAGLAFVLAPAANRSDDRREARFADVERIVASRCAGCHAEKPADTRFPAAPAGVMLDTSERILQQALRVHDQAVVKRAMPIGNLTGMTEEERDAIGRWYRAGARRD